MRVTHPRALDEIAGRPPSRVDVRGTSVPVDDDGTFETDDVAWVRQFAAAHGVAPDNIIVDQEGPPPDDSDTCQVVKTDGEVCGRELPCPYHSDDEED